MKGYPMRPARVLRSILALPFVATVLIPLLLWMLAPGSGARLQDGPMKLLLVFLAAVLVLGAVGLIAWNIALFTWIGKGTLAPWDRTENRVVRGPYRHVRTPMISGVFLILLGESLL